MKNNVCIKCSSSEILPSTKVVTNRYVGIPYNYLSIELYENPDAAISKQRRNFEVRAWVCADCGYTELYVTEPESLRSLVQRTKANRKE